jgi:hypothetical protein
MKLNPVSVLLSSLAYQGATGATLRARHENEARDEPHDHGERTIAISTNNSC